MEKIIKNPNEKNIFFIGRLEEEKGITIVRDIVEQSWNLKKPLKYHIFGEGSYFSYFSDYEDKNVKMYGKVSQKQIQEALKNADAVLMPSLFFETFGLVALESLLEKVPVIGFRKGGLIRFIPQELALDENNPVESFFWIVTKDVLPLESVERFCYENWQKKLIKLTKNYNKILILHDYKEKIGGAEMYVDHLIQELEKIGKKVEFFGYEGKTSSKIRKKLFFSSLLSFSREKDIFKKIQDFQPDLIWSHTILRFIGANGMKAVKKSNLPHFMMHHDLGLFCTRTSDIRDIDTIPEEKSLKDWQKSRKPKGFFSWIITIIKWKISSQIFKNIPENTIHIVPSFWLEDFIKPYTNNPVITFPHTVFPDNESNKKNNEKKK